MSTPHPSRRLRRDVAAWTAYQCRHEPAVEIIARVVLCVVIGVLLALAMVHWATPCSGTALCAAPLLLRTPLPPPMLPGSHPAGPQPTRFAVSVHRPDGTQAHYTRVGGTSCDHAQEAIERAGPGAVVRVAALPAMGPAA